MRMLLTALSIGMATATHAAEVKVMSTNGVKAVLEELVPQFENATKHKLVVRFGPAADLKVQIEKGEPFDLAILTAAAVDDLIKQGKLAAATRAGIARSGAGVAIRKGAPRPDISTAESFRRALLAAKSVAYVGAGATGSNMTKIFDQLGIAAEMKPKIKVLSGISAADAVARGDAELGFTQISEILPVEGAELAGPLPPGIQIYTAFLAAIGAAAKEPAAAQSFIGFLNAPAAAAAIKAKGMEALPSP